MVISTVALQIVKYSRNIISHYMIIMVQFIWVICAKYLKGINQTPKDKPLNLIVYTCSQKYMASCVLLLGYTGHVAIIQRLTVTVK